MVVLELFDSDVDCWYWYGPIPNPSLSYGVSFTL